MSCRHGVWYEEDCEVCSDIDGLEKVNDILSSERDVMQKERDDLRARVAELEAQEMVCIGVIDSNGDIYPAPPESGTRVFMKTPNVELTGAARLYRAASSD